MVSPFTVPSSSRLVQLSKNAWLLVFVERYYASGASIVSYCVILRYYASGASIVSLIRADTMPAELAWYLLVEQYLRWMLTNPITSTNHWNSGMFRSFTRRSSLWMSHDNHISIARQRTDGISHTLSFSN